MTVNGAHIRFVSAASNGKPALWSPTCDACRWVGSPRVRAQAEAGWRQHTLGVKHRANLKASS